MEKLLRGLLMVSCEQLQWLLCAAVNFAAVKALTIALRSQEARSIIPQKRQKQSKPLAKLPKRKASMTAAHRVSLMVTSIRWLYFDLQLRYFQAKK